MNFDRKPRRSEYRYSGPKVKPPSMRYELILDGAVIKYRDGREVCQPSMKGMLEYKRRRDEMAERQEQVCCVCRDPKKLMKPWDTTFEHANGRGANAAIRDDRIVDELGNWMNGAAHYDCNSEKASRRASE